jgi:RNA polymerase subunit RPABC4/transcription elongation factor Spt4
MTTIHFDKICPVCGVNISESGTQFKLATGVVVDKDFVYSRICKYVPASRPEKCPNTSGAYDETQGWEGLDGIPA